MSGNIIKYTIRNECIIKKLEVALIENKMRRNQFRWVENMQWRPLCARVWRSDIVVVYGARRFRR